MGSPPDERNHVKKSIRLPSADPHQQRTPAPAWKRFTGQSQALREATKLIPAAAASNANALISGETGTGKELCAQALHYQGPRAGGPLVTLNCAALPANIFESLLFGHLAGAFTGATGDKRGHVEEAEGGTLFLDEINSVPLESQPKLLRFLDTKQFHRLGCSQLRQADVRIIAATNVDLAEEARHGRFRRDLYQRLKIFSFTMPPLRARREDIPSLAQSFLKEFAEKYHKEGLAFSPEALQKLFLYDWPGNVRELKNAIEPAVAASGKPALAAEDINLESKDGGSEASLRSLKFLKARAVEEVERTVVCASLAATDGNVAQAAKLVGKHVSAFWALMHKYHMHRERSGHFPL